MQIKCHFYDILLLCIRIENNQHLFSFVSYVPHFITCSCTKIQPQPNIFMEFRSSLMCCTISACAKGQFSIKSAVLWFGLSQSLLIPNSMDCHFLVFNLELLLRLSTHLIYGESDRCTRHTMLTLSGAPDLFQTFTGFVILTKCWSS